MVVLHVRNKQEQKEMGYLQARNIENKMQWWFCMCGTLKTKCDEMFADTEQAKAKGNGLSADVEH